MMTSAEVPSPSKEVKASREANRLVVLVILALLAARFVAHAILRRYSKGILREQYLNSSLLVVTEALKFGISSLFIEGTEGRTLLAEYNHIMSHAAPMLVPAAVYLLMNWISLFAFSHVDASIFAMVQQMKILSTALFAKHYLGRTIDNWRWLVLCILALAVGSIAFRRSALGAATQDKHYDPALYTFGLAAISFEVTLSGWVSNYFEKHLKDKAAGFSVWARNIQMSAFSMLLFIPGFAMEYASSGSEVDSLFFGWSVVTWMLALVGAGTGFLVAFATKLTDSVTKTFATSMGLLLTYLTEVMLLGTSFDIIIAVNSAIAVLAVLLYNQKLSPSS